MPARPARALVALCAAALLPALGAAPATARPVAPGAVPLWMTSADPSVPTTCPQAATLDGSAISALAAQPGKPTRVLFRRVLIMMLGAAAPPPTVLVCDPDQLASHQFLGAITGDSALETTDEAFWGQRGLLGSASAGPNGLRPGDRLAFPSVGSRATIDVTVALGKGIRTIRLPQVGGAPATGVRVTGTVDSPQLVATGPDGAEATVLVAQPALPSVAPRFRARVRAAVGGRMRARVTAPPGTITMLAGGSTPRGVTSRVIGASGRATLRVTVKPRQRHLRLISYSPSQRAGWALECKLRAGSQPVCGKVQYGLDSIFDFIIGDFTSVESDGSASASRHAARRSARRAAATPPTAATITRITSGDGNFGAAAGDLNGDGRPDAWRLVGSWRKPRTELLISNSVGGWSTVKVHSSKHQLFEHGVGPDGDSDGPTTPDLDGDGRGELVADGNVVVTNAFAGATLPASVDLSKQRQPSDRDLLPGAVDDFNLLGVPNGALADSTGDGRPELYFVGGVTGAYASEAVPYGRLSHQARIYPTSDLTTAELDAIFDDEGFSGDERNDPASTRDEVSSLAVGGRLFMIEPASRRAVDRAARPITLAERRAGGEIVASRTFSAAGWPILLDVDPVSGDALVRMLPSARCKEASLRDLMKGRGGCPEQLLRVDASGAVTATISLTRSNDQVPVAVFAADGSDADARPDLLVSLTGGLNPGELSFLPSASGGPHALDELSRIALGGKRADDLVQDLKVVVLPNGTRWPVVATSPVTSESESAPNELLLVQPK